MVANNNIPDRSGCFISEGDDEHYVSPGNYKKLQHNSVFKAFYAELDNRLRGYNAFALVKKRAHHRWRITYLVNLGLFTREHGHILDRCQLVVGSRSIIRRVDETQALVQVGLSIFSWLDNINNKSFVGTVARKGAPHLIMLLQVFGPGLAKTELEKVLVYYGRTRVGEVKTSTLSWKSDLTRLVETYAAKDLLDKIMTEYDPVALRINADQATFEVPIRLRYRYAKALLPQGASKEQIGLTAHQLGQVPITRNNLQMLLDLLKADIGAAFSHVDCVTE